jgi:hypothetical protein
MADSESAVPNNSWSIHKKVGVGVAAAVTAIPILVGLTQIWTFFVEPHGVELAIEADYNDFKSPPQIAEAVEAESKNGSLSDLSHFVDTICSGGCRSHCDGSRG